MNRVVSAAGFKKAEQKFLAAEGMSNWQLMEQAATLCCNWLALALPKPVRIVVFAGHGHNGGDGLALARMLDTLGHTVKVFRVPSEHYAPDNAKNAGLLRADLWLTEEALANELASCEVIIDALLGYGTNRRADQNYKACIERINEHPHKVIYSIDLPSGMPAELPFDSSWPVVNATHTLCFAFWKHNLLLPEGGNKAGKVHGLPLGIEAFVDPTDCLGFFIDALGNPPHLPARMPFSHKGNYGHALLIAGSDNMLGAALLAAEGCLRSGAGKTTVAGPASLQPTLASRLPEAMFLQSDRIDWSNHLSLNGYNAVGIGPGLGISGNSSAAFAAIIEAYHGNLVLDADALNLLAAHPTLLEKLPPNTILTPHPKEFDHLFGTQTNWWMRLQTANQLAQAKGWIIVLKNARTFIILPSGNQPVVNGTGNPGLAKGGSGDVLTGIITGLLAQGLSPTDATILGVHLHGSAADLAIQAQDESSLLASDLCKHLGKAIFAYKQTSNGE